MGAISKHINENKGYVGGFAWGFWLGIIGIIVVACKTDISYRNNSYNYNSQSGGNDYIDRLSDIAKEKSDRQTMAEGGWQCEFCRRVNAKYVGTCACGKTHFESEKLIEEMNKPKPTSTEAELEEARCLFEKGIITEEEYQAKRNKILSL